MEKWIKDMYFLAKNDYRHKEFEKEMNELEPRFLQIREKLSEEERDVLDLYISACEHFNYTYIYAAYQMGWHECALSPQAASSYLQEE